jgi:hypothetical protein
MLDASNIHYDLADRTRAIAARGIGMIHRVVTWLRLDHAINRAVNLFKMFYLNRCYNSAILSARMMINMIFVSRNGGSRSAITRVPGTARHTMSGSRPREITERRSTQMDGPC